MPHLISLFLHLLLTVNYEEKRWYDGKEEITIPTGSLIFSLGGLAEQTGLSIRQVRVALDHYENMNMLTRKTTSRWTQIWIVNWSKYQGSNTDDVTPMTNQRQTNDKPMTTTKEIKNKRTREREETLSATQLPQYLISIPLEDYPSLKDKTSATDKDVLVKGETLHNWYLSNPTKNKRSDWKAVLRNALLKDFRKEQSYVDTLMSREEMEAKGLIW